MKQVIGTAIHTEWHDGPLRSIRLVTFEDRDKLVQVDTNLATIGEPFTIGYDHDVREVSVRFDRQELVKMIALLDGLPVMDYNDDVRMSVPESEHDDTPSSPWAPAADLADAGEIDTSHAEVLRNAAVMLATYVAGARGAPPGDERAQRILSMWGALAERVEIALRETTP